LCSVKCSVAACWMFCSPVSLMNCELLVGMWRSFRFDGHVRLCIFAIAATPPINRKAASQVEQQGRTSNFTVLLVRRCDSANAGWPQVFPLVITAYVICHRRWGIQCPRKIKASACAVQPETFKATSQLIPQFHPLPRKDYW
jgi:hypothetical protein